MAEIQPLGYVGGYAGLARLVSGSAATRDSRRRARSSR
jgi:hypothetical protein